MAVSHLFRDMMFVKAGRLQINGLHKEIHINAKICNLSFWDPKEIRNRHIYIRCLIVLFANLRPVAGVWQIILTSMMT